MSLLPMSEGPLGICPYTDPKGPELTQTRFHACRKCLDTEEFMLDFLKRFESPSEPEAADAFLHKYKATYEKPIQPSQPAPNSALETPTITPPPPPPTPLIPEIKVPITPDMHTAFIIETLKARHDPKAYAEHLTALNHHTKALADLLILHQTPPPLPYDTILQASRTTLHHHRRSQTTFNPRGLAQASAYLVIHATATRLSSPAALLAFLSPIYKHTLAELRRLHRAATPRYEENLHSLFHAASARAIAEHLAAGGRTHAQLLRSNPRYRSICALGAWSARHGTPGRAGPRAEYLDELETYWALFDAEAKMHAGAFVHAWSWVAGRKIDLRYGERGERGPYPEMEMVDV